MDSKPLGIHTYSLNMRIVDVDAEEETREEIRHIIEDRRQEKR